MKVSHIFLLSLLTLTILLPSPSQGRIGKNRASLGLASTNSGGTVISLKKIIKKTPNICIRLIIMRLSRVDLDLRTVPDPQDLEGVSVGGGTRGESTIAPGGDEDKD